MKIIVKKESGTESGIYKDALSIRRQVFVLEQKIDANIEIDTNESKATYVVVYADDVAASTGRYRKTEAGIKLERFATLPDFRGKGLGKVILDEIIKSLSGTDKIYLHSQESAVGFYLKNRFKIDGDPFYEAGIRHYKMIYSI